MLPLFDKQVHQGWTQQSVNSLSKIFSSKKSNHRFNSSEEDLDHQNKIRKEPTINKNLVYFPTYEPTDTTNACKTGKAILGQYDTKCGTSTIFTLGTGVLSKVVVQGDKLYIGISGEAEDKGKFTSKDNLITAESEAEGDGTIKLEGWKENYYIPNFHILYLHELCHHTHRS